MRGAVLWLTGLSGAGKSTLATAVGAQIGQQRAVEILDGDVVRAQLSAELGFSREDRDTNVRRIGYVATLLARNGVFVIAAAIAPYADTRAAVRAQAQAARVPFLEVFLNPPLSWLIAHDVKGLYRRALAGDITHFTGITDPYEAPGAPDLEIRTDAETVAESAARIMALLRDRRLLARSRRPS